MNSVLSYKTLPALELGNVQTCGYQCRVMYKTIYHENSLNLAQFRRILNVSSNRTFGSSVHSNLNAGCFVLF
jgi:hypothetical protein